MKHSSTRAVSAIAALTLVVGVTGAATSAAATKQNTFVLSGQVSGTLTLNSSLTCSADNIQKMPLEDTVRIYLTAHGISQAERQRLEGAGKKLIDTTCPLVTRAHQAAQKLQAEGCHMLVIGKRGHVCRFPSTLSQ